MCPDYLSQLVPSLDEVSGLSLCCYEIAFEWDGSGWP